VLGFLPVSLFSGLRQHRTLFKNNKFVFFLSFSFDVTVAPSGHLPIQVKTRLPELRSSSSFPPPFDTSLLPGITICSRLPFIPRLFWTAGYAPFSRPPSRLVLVLPARLPCELCLSDSSPPPVQVFVRRVSRSPSSPPCRKHLPPPRGEHRQSNFAQFPPGPHRYSEAALPKTHLSPPPFRTLNTPFSNV